MTTLMFNKANAQQAAERLYRLYSRQMHADISVGFGIPPPPEMAKEPPLVDPQPDDNVCRERDPICWKELPILLEIYRRNARRNYHNPDDSLPAQLPIFHFENAIETAMLGGKVRFMGTHLHTFGDPLEPLIKVYRSFHWHLPDEGNIWLQRYLDAYRFMVQHAGNDFALKWQAGFMGMNLAVQLRGAEQAYVDMTENPDDLRKLLNYANDLNVYLYGRVQEIVGKHNQRLYGNHPLAKCGINHQSVDAYSLCRPGTLSQWDMDNLTRFNKLTGGTNLHIHENSRHVIEEVAEIPGWSLIGFTDGPGWPRAFDIRWELRKRMKDIPLAFGGFQKEEFLLALKKHDLPGNAQYGFGVSSLDEAKQIMDQILRYKAPC